MNDQQMELYLREDFREMWKGVNPFDEVFQLTGTVYRNLDGRRTLRFEKGGRGFFLKLHTGVGWPEIFKNLVQMKRPILGAENEWRAIHRLNAIGVDTMNLAAYGSKGRNPARRVSFVITDELNGMRSLEEVTAAWKEHPPPVELKRFFAERIASMSQKLHSNGMNHRDYYICHFLTNATAESWAAEPVRVVLIDLHRVELRRQTPVRWVCKDLGALCFSAMDIGLTKRDLLRFMRDYSGKSLRRTLREDGRFWEAVRRRAVELYRKVNGRVPGLLA